MKRVNFDLTGDLEESDTENVAEMIAKDKKMEAKKRSSINKEVKNVSVMQVSGKKYLSVLVVLLFSSPSYLQMRSNFSF